MKILHTADWHLGKIVQGVSLLEDQKEILEQLLTEIDTRKPDVIIIAGDIYDRSYPPTDAVKLMNDMMNELILKRGIPVLAIAGNHDSTTRIHFGSEILSNSGFHLYGELDATMKPVIIEDEHGPVAFYLIPFADPQTVRYAFQNEDAKTNQQAMATIINAIEQTTERSVCIAHAFVTKNGIEEDNPDDSERPLSIGGSECVNANLFEAFHYTALGHLHQAHFVQSEKIRYSGSPLKYSVSEATHKKGYLMIELDAAGDVTIEKYPLYPKRDLRRIEGHMSELLKMEPSEDYVYVTLLDEAVIMTPMEKIRTVFPNALHVERKVIYTAMDQISTEESKQNMDSATLFKSFYNEILGGEPDAEIQQLFDELLEEELVAEREGGTK